MTIDKQKAHDYMHDMLTGHHENATHNHYADVHTALGTILNQLESQVCENCSLEDTCPISSKNCNRPYTFGCTDFKRKVNDN